MKKLLIAAFAVASMGASTMAFAQYTSSIGSVHVSDLSVRGGFVYALNTALRDQSTTLLGLGADYRLAPILPKSSTYVSFDWITKATTGGSANIFPLCLNERFPLSSNKYGSTYFFVGAGVFFNQVGGSTTVLGVRGGLGIDLSSRIFLEATGTLSQVSHGIETNTAGLYVGYRF